MKKQLIHITLTGLISLTSINALADGISNPFSENGEATKFYVGSSLGYSRQAGICNETFINNASCDDSGMSFKIYGGARINPMFGVEGGYRKFNNTKIYGNDGSGNLTSLDKSISGFDAELVGYFPVTNEIEAFGKAGLLRWSQDTTKKEQIQETTANEKGTSLLVGAGGSYQINENLKVRTEWERVFKTGGTNSSETDINMLSAGMTFTTF